MTPATTQGLDPRLIDQAMSVTLPLDELTHEVSRAIINGAVVIYNSEQTPDWLAPILEACDENGNIPD